MEVMATKNRIATFRSATTAPGANGTTIHTSAAGMNIAIGAPRKTQRSARPGETFSLVNNLNTSASRLQEPTRPDPVRPVAQVDVRRHLALGHREDGREVQHQEQYRPEGEEEPDRLQLEQVQDRLHPTCPSRRRPGR